MTPADPNNSTTAPAVQEARRGPRRAARTPVDYTLTERHRAAVERLEQLADDIVGRLDLLDIDPDLEDGGEAEPVLGAPEITGARPPSFTAARISVAGLTGATPTSARSTPITSPASAQLARATIDSTNTTGTACAPIRPTWKATTRCLRARLAGLRTSTKAASAPARTSPNTASAPRTRRAEWIRRWVLSG
jgi:hypothetical protein